MPTYDFKNTDTDEVTEMVMSISEMEQFKKDNPNMKMVISTPKQNLITGKDGAVLKQAGDGWKEVQDRIKSRLAGGLVVDIDVPDLELKEKIIKKKIEEIQSQFKENINLSDEVISYIAGESKTNIRELIGVLNRVIAFSRVHNKNLTVSDCKNILKDVFNQIRIITVDKIQNVVSNYFNIGLSEMLSQRRSRPLARPRQIAMFLAKKMTTRSLPEIGRRFANRDHTTVIHAVKTITRLSEQDDEMKKNIIQIKSILLEQ